MPEAVHGWTMLLLFRCLLGLGLGLVVGGLSLEATETRRILFVAGPPSHGPGLHEFPRACDLLADALNRSGLPVRAEVSRGWPADAAVVRGADTLVIYSDGLQDHVARGHGEALAERIASGRGLVVLHFALEPPPDDASLRAALMEGVGGVFEVDWSVNPTWRLVNQQWPVHPVASGLRSWDIEDEWYFHLRFVAGIEPVLAVAPPTKTVEADGPRTGNPTVRAAVAAGVPQVVAWTHRASSGARGFGFTGGHFLRNWYDDGFRTLVLNGIVWTAGMPVPPEGVPIVRPTAPLHATIDEAIARGDVDDARRHLDRDASLANGSERARMRPLHQAILRRRPEIVRLLLERGADPRMPDGSSRSPLQMAVERGDLIVVEALLRAGAEVNGRDKAGWTPLHHAGAKNQLEIARRLIAGGADARILSQLGGTALHEAAVGGGPDLLRLLIESGADPAIVSQTGVTALDLARQYGNAPGAAFLESVTPTR